MLCLCWRVIMSRCFSLFPVLLILFVYVATESAAPSENNPLEINQFRAKRQGPGFHSRSHHIHHGHRPQNVMCRPGNHRRGGFGACHHTGRRRRIWPPRIDENNRDFRYPTHHHHTSHHHSGNEVEYYENRRVVLLRDEEIRK